MLSGRPEVIDILVDVYGADVKSLTANEGSVYHVAHVVEKGVATIWYVFHKF
jgi:hypothetical protein